MAHRAKKTKPLSSLPLWEHVDRGQLITLTRAFYSGALKRSDEAAVPGAVAIDGLPLRHDGHDKAIPMPHLVPQGKSLQADVTHGQMEEVILHLRRIKVQVGGMGVQGWHEYVIRTLLKLEQPHWAKNELMPKVKPELHYEASLEVLGRAFQRLVLFKNDPPEPESEPASA